MATTEEKSGRLFIVDGEDTRESFSVPTCQYGKPHPVSLLIDGENRTIHLIRRCLDSPESLLVSKGSIHRALLKPASTTNNGQSLQLSGASHSLDAVKEKKADSSSSIDRVITAALSRWKIRETTIGSTF
jgi:hypothetical protein